MAREAARRCALDRVLFIPAGRPPHKWPARMRPMRTGCAWWNSLAPMTRASKLRGWRKASRKATRSIPSKSCGPRWTPPIKLFFLIGADAFAEIETWRRWREVVRVGRVHCRQPAPPPLRNSGRSARPQAGRSGIADFLLRHSAENRSGRFRPRRAARRSEIHSGTQIVSVETAVRITKLSLPPA